MLLHRLMVGLTASLLLVSHAAAADDAKADAKALDEAFKAKGIKRLTTGLVLTDEVELGNMLRDSQKYNKSVFDAAKELAVVEARANETKRLIKVWMQQATQLRAQYLQSTDINTRNNIVVAMEQLDSQIKQAEEGGGVDAKLKEARGKVNQAREAYVEHLLKARKLADQIEKKVADLSIDPEVKKLIDQANKDREPGKEFAMVESRTFQSACKSLKSLEDKILSETIELHREEGSNLFTVSTVINGRYTKELGLDTGASLNVLPYKMAKEVGAEPTVDSPTIQLKLADGRVIAGKLVTIESLRVGKFTVEKVEAAVMPENLPEAAACIGQTFLEHFSYRVDSDSGKLTMTKVETPTTRAPIGGK